MINNQNNIAIDAQSELQLTGNCGFDIQQDRVTISIGGISNQRWDNDVSGTLAVELWALKHPYQGAGFNGHCLAGTTIGELKGQHFLENCQYDLLFNEPSIGSWQIVLMLREWTESGYETRDFVNFAVPYVVTWTPSVVQSKPAEVISVNFKEAEVKEHRKEVTAEKPVAKAEVKQDKVEQAKVEPAEVKPEQAKIQEVKPQAKAEVKTEVKATVKAETKPVPKAEVKPTEKAAPQASGKICLNSATAKEIAALDGISNQVAARIVEARPFSHIKDVLKVKGIGEKLLRRIHGSVSL